MAGEPPMGGPGGPMDEPGPMTDMGSPGDAMGEAGPMDGGPGDPAMGELDGGPGEPIHYSVKQVQQVAHLLQVTCLRVILQW